MRLPLFLLIAALLTGCGPSDHASVAIRDMYASRQKISESADDYRRRQTEAYVDVPLMKRSTDHEMDLRWAKYDSDTEKLAVTIPLEEGFDSYRLLVVDQWEFDFGGLSEPRTHSASFVALNLPGPQPAWLASLEIPRQGMPDKLSEFDWRITYVPAVGRDWVAVSDSMWAGVVLRSIELRNRKSGSVFWTKAFPAAASSSAAS